MAEPRQYTAGETVRLAALMARSAVAMGRGGKGLAEVDREVAQLQEEACAREAAEDKAREDARLARVKARAERKWF